MDFSKRQGDPRRHLVGFTLVILFHVLIVYALVTGLAKKVVDVVRAPIETKVIEEIKKPPPPPEIVAPPPPRLARRRLRSFRRRRCKSPPRRHLSPPSRPCRRRRLRHRWSLRPRPLRWWLKWRRPPPPPPPKPQGIQAYCSSMPKPEVPGVDFVGKIGLTARATIKGNKIEKVEMVPGSFTGTTDRKIQRAFINSVTQAMLSYTCTGDNIIVEQPFAFTITN